MIIDMITKEDLQTLREELIEKITELLSLRQTSPQWLKVGDLKQILPISTSTLQTLRLNGTLPFTKVGGIIYYKKEDIERMMNNASAANKMQPSTNRGRKRNPSLK